MHTYTPNQCPHQVSTFYALWNTKNSPDKILKLMVITTRSKVKSRSHHDLAYLPPLTNVSLPSINFLHFTVSGIARQNFTGQGQGQLKVIP